MFRLVAVSILIVTSACADRGGQPAATSTPIAALTPTPPPPTPTPTPDPWVAASALESPDPATLASRLVAAENEIHTPGAGDDALARAALDQQVAYRQLVARPAWVSEVMRRIPTALRPVVRTHIDAGAALRRLTPPRDVDVLPKWRIVAPRPAVELRRYYDEGQATFGVPWYLLAAVNFVETRMGRIRGLSTAGARGPMQFIPATWARYGRGNIDDAHDSILAAARYLRASGAPGNLSRALYHYNPSNLYVRGVLAYANRMRDDPAAFRAYYHWRVYVATKRGDALLDEGWQAA
jgi:membrane-bound lytic murein transglycosylase B